MSVILENVFVKDSRYSLTTLPRQDNGIWKQIKNLSLKDTFIYTGDFQGTSAIMTHTGTGISYPLMLALFVDSNRFYHSSKVEDKTALVVISPTRISPFDGPRNLVDVLPGTIFESYESTSTNYYLVKAKNGKMYHVSKSVVVKLVDIENEVSSVVVDKTPKPEVTENSLNFSRSVTLNGFEFSSSRDADLAETLITKINHLINSIEFSTVTDTENALKLAKQMGVMC